jgi:predicted PurR-regulated permease PerM
VHAWLKRLLFGRSGLAAAVLALLALALLIAPSVMLTDTLIGSASGLVEELRSGSFQVPPPPPAIERWPLVGEPLHRTWSLASENLAAALRPLQPHLGAVAVQLVSTSVGTGVALLHIFLSVVLAAVLLAYGEASGDLTRRVAGRLFGGRGPAYAELVQQTLRGVARGIVGVALIQAALAALGFLAAGVPGAGLWALLCLVLAVVQLPIALLLIPVAIYVFSVKSALVAVPFAIWCVLVGALDNVLKPLLLGRGLRVPAAVIFAGAIGGFLSLGIVGLFVGAVVLAVAYELFLAWLRGGATEAGDAPGEVA